MTYLEELAADKHLPLALLRGLGVEQHPMQDGVFIHYGDGARTSWRTKSGVRKWLPTIRGDMVVYGSRHPGNAALAQELGWAFIVEGESDCWALWFNGLPAFGVPGASQAGKLDQRDLNGLGKVFVVEEPDQAGSKFPTKVAARIAEIAPAVRVFAVTMPDGVKDPSDLWIAHCDDVEEFHSLLANAQSEAMNRGPVAVHHDEVDDDQLGRFTIIHGDDIETLPEPEWLIEGVLVRGSSAWLYGPSGTGKTFIVLDILGCIAAGLDWHGLAVHQGNVVFIAAEGVGDLGLRVEAFRVSHNLDALPGVFYVVEPVNLMTDDPYQLVARSPTSTRS